jgi:hypothetical protein
MKSDKFFFADRFAWDTKKFDILNSFLKWLINYEILQDSAWNTFKSISYKLYF